MTLKWEGFSGPPSPNSESIMKHYLILKNCIAGGSRRQAGDVVELPDSEGNILISMGRVEATSAPKVETKPVDRSVVLEDSDAPKLKKRGRSKKNAASD